MGGYAFWLKEYKSHLPEGYKLFRDMIGQFTKVYINVVLVMSPSKSSHLNHLTMAFEQIRKHKLKMDRLKCAFGVQARNFLGFLVCQ